MARHSVVRHGFTVALLVAVSTTLVARSTDAQQPPAPPPAWKQGQPPEMATSPLAPHPLPPTPRTAKDLPIDKVKLPPGFRMEVWAEGAHNARQMVWGQKGTLFVGTRVPGTVYAIVDRGGRREVKTMLKGLTQPSGLAFKDGALYVAEIPHIRKYEGIEDRLDNPPDPTMVIDLPKQAHHNWRYLAFGPDGKLYFNMGAPCNICMPPDTHANIARVNPDGSAFEYFARGVRNSVGFDWHPATRDLYFTNHARDWLHDNYPEDTLHHANRAGLHFGFPFCHQGDLLDSEFGQGRSCAEFAPPLLKLGPHVAAMGVRFYTGSMFPPEYRNVMFIAQKGSWNRTQKIGFRVMTVKLPVGRPPVYETFAEGWLQGDQFRGRPTYIEWMPDGSMLLSDDYTGAIYRITYRP